MYSHRIEFPHESSYSAENDPSKIFSCIRASANTGPACIRAKIIPPEFLPACIGFVPGGIFQVVLDGVPPMGLQFKNLLTPLFLMGCFTVDFQEVKRPLRAKSVKCPIKVGKRPINEGKRPIKAVVLVGIAAGCLMGCFRASQPWWKTAPLKRPIKRSMSNYGKKGRF